MLELKPLGLRPFLMRAGGREQWREVLGGFWGPFRDNLAQVAGVAVTDIIDVLNDQLGAHFFPQQARVSFTAIHSQKGLPIM